MDTFLKDIGLPHAIPVFSHHRLEMAHLNKLTEFDMKNLLPLIGDRQKLKLAIQKIRQQNANSHRQIVKTVNASDKTSDKSNFHKEEMRNDSMKKEIKVQALNSYKNLTEKLNRRVIEMIEDHVPATWFTNRMKLLSGLINHENGTINCPFCTSEIELRYRPSAKTFTWNICTFKRHLTLTHSEPDKLKYRVHF